MYLMVATRPDIAFAVGRVSQYSSDYRTPHWQAVKRILRTHTYGLTVGGAAPGGGDSLSTFADADFANDLTDRKSISGFMLSICGGGPFAWKSRKQSLTTLSTTEAECVALTSANQHTLHYRRF